MKTIDHQFFPHIIDEIWRSMSMESTRAARWVSRAWKERANRILQCHVQVTPGAEALRIAAVNTDELDGKWNSDGPAWSINHQDIHNLTLPRHPLDPSLPTPALQELCRNIHHLDLDGWNLSEKEEGGSEIRKVVQILNRYYPLRTARITLVDLMHLNDPAEADTTVYFNISETFTRIKAHRVRHLVLNLNFLPRVSLFPEDSILDTDLGDRLTVSGGFRSLHSLVMLFHAERSVDKRRIRGEVECINCAREFVLFAYPYWNQIPGPTTLVGLESFFANEHFFQVFRQFLLGLESRARAQMAANDFVVAESGVEVLTHAEYETLVGPETYRLHAVG